MNEQLWRELIAERPVEKLRIAGRPLGPGDRVRLHPRAKGDVFDVALDGKTAAVESVEQDLEGNFLVSVVVEDDPGGHFGMMRQPGHRFFFTPGELEPLDPAEGYEAAASAPNILVAGIGNVFLGDDGFGVEVVQRLAPRPRQRGVRVEDFGIRGYDLAYALMARPDHTILIDACPRGEAPGTLYVVEPGPEELDGSLETSGLLDAHDMNPLAVLRLARSLGGTLGPVIVVGCEPATLGPEEGLMGLSEPVAAAVDAAVSLVESLVARLLTPER